MLRLVYLLFSIILWSIVNPVTAQNSIDDTQVYGLDPILHNGKVYNYFPNSKVIGHQYFEKKNYDTGCVSIRNNKYDNVLLNYDLLNQEVILKYIDPQGSNRLLMVSKAWLEKFSIANEQFSIISAPDGQKLIVQTLNQGPLQLHSHWTKKLVADISFVSENYMFDQKRNNLYLSYRNNLKEYKSTKDILSLFNGDHLLKIKHYIKQNNIKPRTKSLDQLKGLLNYCNQIVL